MATYITDKIKFNNGDTYILKDSNALPLTGGTVTGPVTFNDSVSMDEATVGDLVVNGNLSTTNNIQANTINGVSVGSSPKFTDTTYSNATTSAAGLMSSSDKSKLDGIAAGAQVNAVTSVAGKTGAVTLAKGDVGLGNVENKSSATIRGELTKDNVTAALGYTPPTTNTTYSNATTSAAGLMSSDDKSKLNGIASGAEVNQNAFSNVKVGSTTVAADGKTDTLELAGSNVTLTPDATNDKVTIGITKDNVTAALGYTPPTTNTTYSNATTSAAGLMSSSDKSKLDGIASGAQVNAVTSVAGKTGAVTLAKGDVGLGNVENKSSATIRGELTKANVTDALGYTPPTTDTNTAFSYMPTPGDNRTVATTPNSYSNKLIFQGIKSNSTIGSPSTDTYSYVVGLRGWSDSSGGDSYEVAFNNNGLYIRHGATTSWNGWEKVYTSGNLSKSTLGLGNVENKSSATIRGELTKANVTDALGYTPPTTNTTYSNATTSAAGLMSSGDKSKLDGIAAGAQVNAVTSVAGKTGAVTLAKGDVGLGNVENKSSATIRSELTKSNVTTALGYTPKIQVSTSKPSFGCSWFKVTKEVTV